MEGHILADKVRRPCKGTDQEIHFSIQRMWPDSAGKSDIDLHLCKAHI